jgi:hypothetical protein
MRKRYQIMVDPKIMEEFKFKARCRKQTYGSMLEDAMQQFIGSNLPKPQGRVPRRTDLLSKKAREDIYAMLPEALAEARRNDPGTTRRFVLNRLIDEYEEAIRLVKGTELTRKEGTNEN